MWSSTALCCSCFMSSSCFWSARGHKLGRGGVRLLCSAFAELVLPPADFWPTTNSPSRGIRGQIEEGTLLPNRFIRQMTHCKATHLFFSLWHKHMHATQCRESWLELFAPCEETDKVDYNRKEWQLWMQLERLHICNMRRLIYGSVCNVKTYCMV